MFKREAREQLDKDLKKMVKAGWHVRIVTDEGVGRGQVHTGRLTGVCEKELLNTHLKRSHKL
jgi:hypothetical protein